VDLCPRFLVPFLRSIFAPFLVNSQSRICLFYGTFWPTRVVFGPFLDRFFTVHLGVGFAPFGTLLCPVWFSSACCIVSSTTLGYSALVPVDDWVRRERFVFVGWSGLLLLPTAYLAVGGWLTGITFVSSTYTHGLASCFLEGCNVLTAAVSTPSNASGHSSQCERVHKWPRGVEALTIGAVLGFSFTVWLGLMTVVLVLSQPSDRRSFTSPRDATGKIV
jgi:hypothetical protein